MGDNSNMAIVNPRVFLLFFAPELMKARRRLFKLRLVINSFSN